VNGWIDALLVIEIVERRVTGRWKNDIVIEQLGYFNGQSCRMEIRFNYYFLSLTCATCSS